MFRRSFVSFSRPGESFRFDGPTRNIPETKNISRERERNICLKEYAHPPLRYLLVHVLCLYSKDSATSIVNYYLIT